MYEWAELRHFRYLLTILERQGFRAAAEELRTAQPNLSVQARQFQENASVRLFRKMKGGRIRPTDTGVAFKVLARFLLETRDEVLDALIAIERGEVGSVRFGCHPQRHPDAHERLLELLRDAGVQIEEYSCASHPSEMQSLVKGGHGFALIREGTSLDEELTTRPVAGVDWTVDTALIYHKVRHPKTIPILVKRLIKQIPQNGKETAPNKVSVQTSIANGKRPSQRATDGPVQMTLIS
jgi:DNA-binding transcriptional LysR family regulator